MQDPAKKPNTQTAADKLFNFRPVLFAAIFLALGILFAYFHDLYGVSARWAFCLLPAAATPFFFCRSKNALFKTLLSELALALCFGAGVTAFSRQVEDYRSCGQYDGEYSVLGRVVDYKETDYGLRVTFDELIVGTTEEEGRLVAYLPASFSDSIRLSDEILLYGHVYTQTEVFDEYGFCARDIDDGVRFFMRTESCSTTGRRFDAFLYLRERIKDVVYAGMDETSAAVTMAVLTGDTSGMDGDLLENVRRGGIAHIFAVSGLHIGALYAFCLWLIKKTRLKTVAKPVRFAFTACMLLFYGGVCGYSDSVVRAIAMCLTVYASALSGIAVDPLERVGLAAGIVLLISPVSLFEVGFQLSFVACLGIVLLAKRLSRLVDLLLKKFVGLFVEPKPEVKTPLYRDGDPLTVGQRVYGNCISFLGVTLSAQIATAPVCLYAFGYVSGWAFLLNCLFVPLISAAFSALLLFVTAACALPIAASKVVLYAPAACWSAALLVFEVADFSGFAISGITPNWQFFVCYYAGLLFATDKWNAPRWVRYSLCLICMAATAGIGITCAG